MNRELIENAFSGFIKDEQLFNTINEYLNVISNNRKNNTNFKCNLLICASDENKGIIFASKLAKILKNNDLANSFSCVGSNEDILYIDDVTVIDDYLSDVIDKNILKRIIDTNSIVFFVTSYDKYLEYKKDNEAYYKAFIKEAHIKEYSVDDIIGGCHFLLNRERESKKLDFDDSLFIKLDKYIATVYPRAILKDEAFVLDLIDRLTINSYKSDTPNLINDSCIPYYHEQGLYDDCKKDLLNSFIFSNKIDKILNLVNDNEKIRDLKLDSIKPNFNLHITCNKYADALLFGKLYASLLYSKKLEIINSKQVKELDDLDKCDLKDVHGLVLVSNVSDESKLASLIDEYKNLVWLVYSDKEFEHELKYLFNGIYNLDDHDLDSSYKYVEQFYKSKGLQVNDVDELVKQVNEACDVYKAKEVIERNIVSNITGDLLKEVDIKSEVIEPKKLEAKEESNTDEFAEVLKKEAELTEGYFSVEDNDSERNVILLAMSTLPNGISVNSYIYKDDIKGKYVSQLEPVVKSLAESLHKENKHIDSIYVLNTDRTINGYSETSYNKDETNKQYTAFDYFKERCDGFVGEIKGITLTEGKTGSAVYEFVNSITKDNKKVNLYIDIHGGPRDTFAAVNAVMMLVKEIDNIELKDILSVRYTKGDMVATEVISAIKEYDVFDFVSGMKEFLSFGKSNGLVEFNEKSGNANEKLVKAMNNISDSIVLSQMADFEDRLKNMHKVLDKASEENGYFETVKSLIKRNYVVNYGDKEVNLLEAGDDLLAQIKWCLDKNLLTQALVLVEAKSAVYMNKHGLLQFVAPKNNNKQHKKNKDDYDVSDFLNDLVINSLCTPESNIYQGYGKGEDKEMVDVNIGYFRLYKKDFNGIRAKSFDDAIDKIKNLGKGLTLKEAQKYHNIIVEYTDYNVEYYCTTYKSRVKTRYEITPRVLPVKDTKLLNKEEFVEDYYICLYLYKSLKSFRNAVAHALEYGEKREQYSAKEIKFWVLLYMEMLNKLANKQQDYLNKPIAEKVEVVKETLDYDPNKEASEEFIKKYLKV